MYVKIHKSYRAVVAICDSDLLGKKFEEGNKQLDIRESFYKGEEMPFKEVVDLIKFQFKEDATFNIVGKESTKAAIEAGILTEKSLGKIAEIPYALVLL